MEAAAVTGIAPYMRALNTEAHRMRLSRVTQRSQAGNGWGGRWRREAKATTVVTVPRFVPPEVRAA